MTLIRLLLAAFIVCSVYTVLPQPATALYGNFFVQVCGFDLQNHESVDFDTSHYLNKLHARKHFEANSCLIPVKLHILKDCQLSKQAYTIKVSENTGITIHVGSFSGYVYALETISQLMQDNQGKLPTCSIQDEPVVGHRGIMVDVSRHFISLKALKRTIEIMAMAKLNILHIKFTADQAFAFYSQSHPELSESGAYSSEHIYTIENIKDLITFAGQHAVSIVPEIDTPATARSWSLSPKWKGENVTFGCATEQRYNHIFDASKEKAYQLVRQVITDVDILFKGSPYIHLGGGDLLNTSCWDTANIRTYMKAHNIQNFDELGMHWRVETRSAVQADRKVIYWVNDTNQYAPDGENDIIQFFGKAEDVKKIPAGKSKIILSPRDLTALGSGQGSYNGGVYGFFPSWRMIYEKFVLFPENIDKSRILGAEVTLDTHVCNEDTLDNMLWMRAASFAERVWSMYTTRQSQLVKRIYTLDAAITSIGGEPTPMVSGFCEVYPEVCY